MSSSSISSSISFARGGVGGGGEFSIRIVADIFDVLSTAGGILAVPMLNRGLPLALLLPFAVVSQELAEFRFGSSGKVFCLFGLGLGGSEGSELVLMEQDCAPGGRGKAFLTGNMSQTQKRKIIKSPTTFLSLCEWCKKLKYERKNKTFIEQSLGWE